MYHSAIEAARPVVSKHSTFLSLRSQLAMLLWSNQLLEDRQMAFQLWQANLEEPIPKGTDDDWEIQWAKSQALSKLTRSLTEAMRSDNTRDEHSFATNELIDKLVEVATAHVDDYFYSRQLTEVARLLHVLGDEDRARNMVRDRLINGFKKIEDNLTTFKYGYWLREVAGVLQAFDDDTNALAAWSLALPNKNDAKDDIPGDKTVTGADHVGTRSVEEQQAHGGAEVTDGSTETPSAQSKLASTAKEVSLVGPLTNYCDGRCDTEWSYADNMWVCKDCADVQFDPKCYEKLKNGTLERRVCSPLHYHFFIPPFQKERWLTTPEDQMWVGGNRVAKKEWVEKIKTEWKIDEKTLLVVKAIESSKMAGDLLKRRQTVPM